MRLRLQWPLLVVLCGVSWLLGFEQSKVGVAWPNFCRAETAGRLIVLSYPIFFCTILGIISAARNRNTAALLDLQLLEHSAPLYGRQLARATSFVPCLTVVSASTAYVLAARSFGHAPPVYFIVFVISVSTCATLIALSGSLRTGWQRLLYFGLALGAAFVGLELAAGFPCFSPLGVLCELAFCTLIGFVALRAYGETLARYDPLGE